MILLYTASGLFHAVPLNVVEHPEEFRFFQRIDQSAIFLLIAGTNTPVMMVLLKRIWRRWCLAGMWALAVAGVDSLWLLPKPPHEVIIALCLGMGWLGMLPVAHYYRAVGWKAMNWALLGCTLYTLGTLCELIQWPLLSNYPVRVGPHEIFHIFCAAASLAFFVFIMRYVISYKPKPHADLESLASSSRN